MQESLFKSRILLIVVTIAFFTVFGGVTGLALADSSPDTVDHVSSVDEVEGFFVDSTAGDTFSHPPIPAYQDDTDDGDDDADDAESDEDAESDSDFAYEEASDCQGCHPDVYDAWEGSLHDHAFEAEYFQQAWASVDQDPTCLECHTTDFSPATGEYYAEGLSCVGCHGNIPEEHSEGAAIDKSIAINSCESCHAQTHDEFATTDHAAVGLDCMSCHYPHDNGLRLEEPTTQCLNCHGDNLEGFVHITHIEGDLGCRDCHGWVNPEVPEPVTGLGYTGHDFMSELPSCLDCHESLDLELIADNRATEDLETISEEAVLEGQEAIAENAELRNTIQTLLQVEYNRTVQNVSLGAIGGLLVGSVVTAIALHFRKPLADEEEQE